MFITGYQKEILLPNQEKNQGFYLVDLESCKVEDIPISGVSCQTEVLDSIIKDNEIIIVSGSILN